MDKIGIKLNKIRDDKTKNTHLTNKALPVKENKKLEGLYNEVFEKKENKDVLSSNVFNTKSIENPKMVTDLRMKITSNLKEFKSESRNLLLTSHGEHKSKIGNLL